MCSFSKGTVHCSLTFYILFQQVRVHAPPNDYDRLDYALEVGIKLLSYFEKLFGEPFPLPKLGEWEILMKRFFRNQS